MHFLHHSRIKNGRSRIYKVTKKNRILLNALEHRYGIFCRTYNAGSYIMSDSLCFSAFASDHFYLGDDERTYYKVLVICSSKYYFWLNVACSKVSIFTFSVKLNSANMLLNPFVRRIWVVEASLSSPAGSKVLKIIQKVRGAFLILWVCKYSASDSSRSPQNKEFSLYCSFRKSQTWKKQARPHHERYKVLCYLFVLIVHAYL